MSSAANVTVWSGDAHDPMPGDGPFCMLIDRDLTSIACLMFGVECEFELSSNIREITEVVRSAAMGFDFTGCGGEMEGEESKEYEKVASLCKTARFSCYVVDGSGQRLPADETALYAFITSNVLVLESEGEILLQLKIVATSVYLFTSVDGWLLSIGYGRYSNLFYKYESCQVLYKLARFALYPPTQRLIFLFLSL